MFHNGLRYNIFSIQTTYIKEIENELMSRVIFILCIWLLVDVYFFQAVKRISSNPWVDVTYWLIDLALIGGVLYFFLSGKLNTPTFPKPFIFLLGLLFLSLVPKILALPILILEDVERVLEAGYHFFTKNSEDKFYPDRRKFISQLALGIAAIPFTGMLYGMIWGKYNYKVQRLTLKFKDLPNAFNGFTITQLSDIHAGSFDNREAVQRGIELANQQNSDLMLFTGDFVNNSATELYHWKSLFSSLKAPFGKYSILGNHDYGDYGKWPSPKSKAENLHQLKAIQQEMGFHLLLDEHVNIEKEGQSLSLIGVENWGAGGFQKYGNLEKALSGVEDRQFKILMTHDPSHWEAQVLPHAKKIHLTLSGHTHGMQFGIETPVFRWSPSEYFYKQWAGLYNQADQYINVNRGFGFHGFPGRVGIMPEITVIRLEKA